MEQEWIFTLTFQRIYDLTATLFPKVRGLIYVAPCGVVVRAVAPLLQSKLRDPAVVVADVGHRHVVSLLSGHEGGANDLAVHVANALSPRNLASLFHAWIKASCVQSSASLTLPVILRQSP